MKHHQITSRQLSHLAFLYRENELNRQALVMNHPYELLRLGDPQALEEARRLFRSMANLHLSDDPLRNLRYRFVSATTIASRYAIRGGMNAELAYNASDLYISRMDLCHTLDEIYSLHADMFTFFLNHVQEARETTVLSRTVSLMLSYINNHLHEVITVSSLADYTGLSPNYLSSLFKKETGETITGYITRQKIEAAENMLKYADVSCSEVSSYLAFSSQSYFIRVFRKATGYTPREYRDTFYQIASLTETSAQTGLPSSRSGN